MIDLLVVTIGAKTGHMSNLYWMTFNTHVWRYTYSTVATVDYIICIKSQKNQRSGYNRQILKTKSHCACRVRNLNRGNVVRFRCF